MAQKYLILLRIQNIKKIKEYLQNSGYKICENRFNKVLKNCEKQSKNKFKCYKHIDASEK